MAENQHNLAELIGSRICHDLISPIGAISNGVELLSLSGGTSGPELDLISQSVGSANARIRLFRIAFGAARPGQLIGRSEITGILRDSTQGSRLVVDWQPEGDQERQHVKLALLLLMCFETAMPWGGRVEINALGNNWAVYGQAEQLKVEPSLWRLLSNPDGDAPLTPANVHFMLAALSAADMNRRLAVEVSETSARIRY